MLSINIVSLHQLKKQIANRAKERRLEKNMSRKTLEAKSTVPASTIKRFETTGNISLEALLRIALVLDALAEFSQLFPAKTPVSLFETPIERQRGRQ